MSVLRTLFVNFTYQVLYNLIYDFPHNRNVVHTTVNTFRECVVL